MHELLKDGQLLLHSTIKKHPGITKIELCGIFGIRRSTLQEKLRILLAYGVVKQKEFKHPRPHRYYALKLK